MQEQQQDKKRNMLVIVVLLVFSLSILATINTISKASDISENRRIVEIHETTRVSEQVIAGSAVSSIGTTVLCLNARPQIIYDCNLTNATLNTNDNNNCTFNATDYNNENLTFSVEWLTSPPMFNISSNGVVTYTFVNQHELQVNNFRVYVNDTSVCSNNYNYIEYNVSVTGENRAPYLIQNIPDQEIVLNYYAIYNLNDYFDDPDGDPLNYFPIVTSGSSVSITMSGSRADIRGASCGNSTVYFVASDPFGLTNTSNTLTLSVTCDDLSQDDSSSSSSGDDDGSGTGRSRNNNCDPDWRCTQWSPCRPENKTYKACVDYNGCDRDNYRTFFEDVCTYVPRQQCTENWDCSSWGKCENDNRFRTCIDIRNCGTFNSRPPESEECTGIPSCFNGIKDFDETDIDCGGQCGTCRNIESPAEVERFDRRIILAAALSVGVLGGIGIYYRKRIAAFFRKISLKSKKPNRKIYLTNTQKEKLEQILNIVQQRVDENRTGHAISEISIFIKEYFKQLLAIENLSKQELITNIVKLKDKDLEKLIVMFYAKIINLTHSYNKGIEISKEELQCLVDEMSHNIFLVAEFTDQDAVSSSKDRITEKIDEVSLMFNCISNIYIALKFGELLVARDYYEELMKKYPKLSDKDKYLLYNNIVRSFHAIEYLEKLYKR